VRLCGACLRDLHTMQYSMMRSCVRVHSDRACTRAWHVCIFIYEPGWQWVPPVCVGYLVSPTAVQYSIAKRHTGEGGCKGEELEASRQPVETELGARPTNYGYGGAVIEI